MIENNFRDIIDPRILSYIENEKGFKRLTDIQRIAIPYIYAGSDCIIEAPTAGGKTEAVLFPLFSRIAGNKKESVQILYLAPLKALLNNVAERVKIYSEKCALRYVKWHGDVGQREKIENLKNPPQVMLTTPESLEAILLRKAKWRDFYKDLEVVIIDEAHNFAFGDRGCHLLSLLERLEMGIKNSFQRIAMTATIGNPDRMLHWLAGTREIGKRLRAEVKKEKKKDFKVHLFWKSVQRDLDGNVIDSSDNEIVSNLTKLLFGKKSIVFVPSRSDSEQIATKINNRVKHSFALSELKVRTHHSSVSKFYREKAEYQIKIKSDDALNAIITTCTLELGIDIGELDRVIQVGVLTSSSSFLQRVGRTGRRNNTFQYFRGFCNTSEQLILLTAVVNLGLRGESEAVYFPRKAFHILAHQIICLSLQNHGVTREEIWATLSGAYCFSGIQRSECDLLIDMMVEKKYLRWVENELVVGESAEKEYLVSNWRRLFAVFDSAPMYEVLEGKNQVGTLDERFVETLSVPFLFVLGGIDWIAEKVKHKTRQIIAKRTQAGGAPKWDVFGSHDVPKETALEVGRLLIEDYYPDFLDEKGRDGLDSERNRVHGIPWREKKWIVAIDSSGKTKIWTFLGDMLNRTLSLLIKDAQLGSAVCNYKYVKINPAGMGERALRNLLESFFDQLRNTSLENLQGLEKKLEEHIPKGIRFKFSKCLPIHLNRKAIIERSIDLPDLIAELKSSMICFVDSPDS